MSIIQENFRAFLITFDTTKMTHIAVMRTIIFNIAVLISAASCFAGNIKGTVADATDKSPLANATVRVLQQRDSAYVTGGMTDAQGLFTINVKNGSYIIETSYLGYHTTTKNVTAGRHTVSTDTIAMRPNSIVLDEAEVVGVKTDVKVMQDTVEYNAGSFKTQPNAVVEDLLKRLPGVEVDSEGKITAQGKEVSKILVDGKEFFSDDAKVASKNIPVDIVDKLQVIDRKSDLARLTGVDDGEEETVINLTVKKGMKQGWFGNVTAGYGTNDRYAGNFMVNRFVNDNQFSILGNINNTNDPAFTSPGMGRFSRFGESNGINSTQSIGLNFNVGNEEIFRVGGDVMYSHSNQKTDTKFNKQYLFTDSTSYEDSESSSRDRNHSVNGHFRMKWEADSSNTIDFRPNFTISFNDSGKTDFSTLRAGDKNQTLVNRSDNRAEGNGTSYDLSGELVYNHKFKRRIGRSFSTQVSYKYSNTQEDETSYAINEFFLVPDKNETHDLSTDNRQWTSRIGARLTWTEPLGDIKKAQFLTFAYRMNYYFNNADKLVYDMSGNFDTEKAVDMLARNGIVTNPVAAMAIAGESGVLDEDLSNRFRNDQFTQEFRVGFQQNREKYRLNGGFAVTPTMMRSEDLINSDRNIPTNWVWNYAPFMRFRYAFSKMESLALDYRGSSQSPSLKQLQPVADETDPLRIVVGNPDLVPSFRHRISLRYNNFNQESQRSIMAMVSTNITTNSIISKTIFDKETGGQTTTYDNVNGVWSANAMMMYTSPLRNKNWRIANNLFANFSRTVGFNNNIINRSSNVMISETPSVAFRTDAADFELRPYYNLQITRNSNQTGSNRNVHSYGATFNGTYYFPFGLVLNTDLTYGNTSGYSQGYDSEQWLWNASISYQFLKSKQATIGLRAYDLLHQKQNISRSVTANYIQDSEYNTVTRYFMLTFSYRFTAFGKGTTENDTNYDGFGPRRNRPPHRSGNRPPMPPHP